MSTESTGRRTREEDGPGLPDTEIVRRVRGGEIGLFEILMRRYNQRLYRAARSIVRDEAEAEDVMQASEDVVRTRLHRARSLLRRELLARAGAQARHAFAFRAVRCDRVVRAVLARIQAPLLPRIH